MDTGKASIGQFLRSLFITRNEALILVLLSTCGLLCMLPGAAGGRRNQNAATPWRLENIRLDLNRATWYELELLPGIGEKKAKAIVTHRETAGLFRSLQDLTSVQGMTEALVQQLDPYVKIGEIGGGEETREK